MQCINRGTYDYPHALISSNAVAGSIRAARDNSGSISAQGDGRLRGQAAEERILGSEMAGLGCTVYVGMLGTMR